MHNLSAIVIGLGMLSASAELSAQPTCVRHDPPNENIAAQLSKFKQVQMPAATNGLSPREKQLVQKLVEASRLIESIYWRQSDRAGLALYKGLAGCTGKTERDIRHFLVINGSRYDLLAEHKPFIGKDPYPPGRESYPKGITQKEIDAYVAAHPDKKAEIYHPQTVIKRQGSELVAVPYHIEYREWLVPAAAALRDAASLSDDNAFANYLRLRADALLSDEYYASDVAWVDLENPKFDIIIAPYEQYLDDLLGVKTSYGAAVLVRNEAESRKLLKFVQYVPDIQQALPLSAEDKPSKAGRKAPMEVMDTPFRAGDLRHGYQAVADNLPNDPRIHEEKGSKRIFFKNFMDARVRYVVIPIAHLLMREDHARLASMDGYLSMVVMHEISHGIGPAFARTSAGRVDIPQAIGPIHSALEEAKADVVGMFALEWLMNRGALQKARAYDYYASYVAGIFRTVRFGVAEAHGRAEMMEFNYLAEQRAINREKSGKYSIDFARMPAAIAALAKELLEIEATGDRGRAEAWFAKYDKMPASLRAALAKTSSVPVDIDPVSAFADRIQ
ncbi:MAG: Zn-dependent hydrolase [Gemmatimonadaceae bacterium]